MFLKYISPLGIIPSSHKSQSHIPSPIAIIAHRLEKRRKKKENLEPFSLLRLLFPDPRLPLSRIPSPTSRQPRVTNQCRTPAQCRPRPCLPANQLAAACAPVSAFQSGSRRLLPSSSDDCFHQEVFEDAGKRMGFERMQRIADLAVTPLSYTTQSQLLFLFMKGMLVQDGKTWFSVNKKGHHSELISAQKCISTSDDTLFIAPIEFFNSRFEYLFKYTSNQDLRLEVKTQFLSPNVTYIISLVYRFQFPSRNDLRVPFKYKLEETGQYWTSCVARVGKDGWLRTELFQFTCTKNEHDFNIHFSSEMKSGEHNFITISIEGVEFHPLDFEKQKNKLDMQTITYSDMDWGKRLPDDYTYIVKWSKDIDESMTRKDVYFLLHKGIFINNSQQWFSISKKSKKRAMLPARAILQEEKGWNFLSLPGSRFKEVAESCDNNNLAIGFEVESELLSTGIMYACYLVFKLPENASGFEGIVLTSFETHIPIEHHIYLVTPPHLPIIDEIPSTTRKIKGHPKLRKDGWMEIQVYELYNGVIGYNTFSESGYLKSLNGWNFTGLLVQGLEFRPAKVSWSYSYSVRKY